MTSSLLALPPREKSLLKLSYLDGLSLDEIGALYRAHRTTVGRWLDAARQRILDDTRRGLGERLRLGEAEVDSLMALIRSQLDVTLHSLL